MKRKIVDFMTFIYCLVVSCLSLISCDSEPGVQQEYPFTVKLMPIVSKIADGETVETRLEIRAEEDFSGIVYTPRYSRSDDKGSLKMKDSTVLKPNNRRLLDELGFRLYYTSQSADAPQTIGPYFEDNWENLWRSSYDFSANDTPPAEKDDIHGKKIQP